MAQVSVRGVGGRGSERLRAGANRLRRPTKGRVVLRAASSFLPAFSQSSAPILRPVRLLGGAATCGRVVSDLGSSRVATGFRKVCVAPRRRRGRSSCVSCPRRAFRRTDVVIRWNAIYLGSGASDRNGDEFCRLVRLQPHQQHSLAILVGVPDGIAHIDRGNDLLPSNIEDDVANLKTVLEGKSVAIEIDHDDPIRAGTCDMLGKRASNRASARRRDPHRPWARLRAFRAASAFHRASARWSSLRPCAKS